MLTIKEVEKLAELAKISLTQEEKERYARELSSILGYVEKLQEVKTADNLAEEPKDNCLREDKVIGLSLEHQRELISQAPESADNLISTKPVFE